MAQSKACIENRDTSFTAFTIRDISVDEGWWRLIILGIRPASVLWNTTHYGRLHTLSAGLLGADGAEASCEGDRSTTYGVI